MTFISSVLYYRILIPAFLTAEAVPPEPSNSRPRSVIRLANSTRPRLSDTLSRASHINTDTLPC